jgi:hypothetical protein
LAILLRPFGLFAHKTLKVVWWTNPSTLNVPDEGYSMGNLQAFKHHRVRDIVVKGICIHI